MRSLSQQPHGSKGSAEIYVSLAAFRSTKLILAVLDNTLTYVQPKRLALHTSADSDDVAGIVSDPRVTPSQNCIGSRVRIPQFDSAQKPQTGVVTGSKPTLAFTCYPPVPKPDASPHDPGMQFCDGVSSTLCHRCISGYATGRGRSSRDGAQIGCSSFRGAPSIRPPPPLYRALPSGEATRVTGARQTPPACRCALPGLRSANVTEAFLRAADGSASASSDQNCTSAAAAASGMVASQCAASPVPVTYVSGAYGDLPQSPAISRNLPHSGDVRVWGLRR